MKKSKTYISTSLVIATIFLTCIAFFNYKLDPLYVFSYPSHDIFQSNQRYQNPGLARNAVYDTVVMGTSHTENTLASYVDKTLGVNSIRLSIAGSTAHEQFKTLKIALESKQIKQVIWGVDYFTFLGEPNRVNTQAESPEYLYELGISTPFKYLLSVDTLKMATKALLGKGTKGIDNRNTWFNKFTFSEARVKEAWSNECAHPRTKSWIELASQHKLKESVAENIESLAEAYPEVTFSLFLPPYSAAHYLFIKKVSPDLSTQHLEFRQLLDVINSKHPNIALYDFQQIGETLELSNYKDLTHYNISINELIIDRISNGQNLIHKGKELTKSFDQYLANVSLNMPPINNSCGIEL